MTSNKVIYLNCEIVTGRLLATAIKITDIWNYLYHNTGRWCY